MVSSFAYFPLLGKPLTFYIGILTYLSFLLTATIGYFQYTGKPLVPFKWHPRIAAASLILGLIHGVLAASVYFHY
ncbi:MAG: hypothetical protein M1308_23255 [Actinobacteria bacterium]|nr:hypothetical protein [Actinomycetota bacterium]